MYFLILGIPYLSGEQIDSEFANLQCLKTADSCYELSWESEKGTNCLFFTADDWQELMPLSSAETFLASPNAQTTIIASTDENATNLKSEHKFLRVIAQKDLKAFDFERLMRLNNCEAVVDAPRSKGQFYSPDITEETWRIVAPYLLPEKHALKMTMDKICSKMRILSSVDSLKEAGFKIIIARLNRGLVVASHPNLQGYLIKAYLDTSTRCEWPLWALRAEGSRHIQRILDKHHFNKYMKVPDKWIYAIPQARRPIAGEAIFPKDFILLVKNMNILSKEQTIEKFKNTSSKERLKALFTTIVEGGLSDSHIDNVPYSTDNKIAFIDTEYYKVWPVHPEWITKHLSSVSQLYWEKLIKQGEKKSES
ncbi:MAG: hypothetical protein H0T62_13650 [Parachlamydiaceae bacterium]|nr:hypothetical protein [Parachlamydiaceae bacterium]